MNDNKYTKDAKKEAESILDGIRQLAEWTSSRPIFPKGFEDMMSRIFRKSKII